MQSFQWYVVQGTETQLNNVKLAKFQEIRFFCKQSIFPLISIFFINHKQKVLVAWGKSNTLMYVFLLKKEKCTYICSNYGCKSHMTVRYSYTKPTYYTQSVLRYIWWQNYFYSFCSVHVLQNVHLLLLAFTALFFLGIGGLFVCDHLGVQTDPVYTEQCVDRLVIRITIYGIKWGGRIWKFKLLNHRYVSENWSTEFVLNLISWIPLTKGEKSGQNPWSRSLAN